MKAIEKLITFIHSENRNTMIREGRESLYLVKEVQLYTLESLRWIYSYDERKYLYEN